MKICEYTNYIQYLIHTNLGLPYVQNNTPKKKLLKYDQKISQRDSKKENFSILE